MQGRNERGRRTDHPNQARELLSMMGKLYRWDYRKAKNGHLSLVCDNLNTYNVTFNWFAQLPPLDYHCPHHFLWNHILVLDHYPPRTPPKAQLRKQNFYYDQRMTLICCTLVRKKRQTKKMAQTLRNRTWNIMLEYTIRKLARWTSWRREAWWWEVLWGHINHDLRIW